MDMALVASVMAMKQASTQQQIATSVIKQNADMERSTVLTLLEGAPSQANLGAGVGGKVDVAA